MKAKSFLFVSYIHTPQIYINKKNTENNVIYIIFMKYFSNIFSKR